MTDTPRRRRKTPAIIGIHPFADMFPMVSDDELTDLADDISRNGLRKPIDITPEGLVLDGRNRLAACKRAKVEPTVEVYDGDDPANFVLSANIHRRHLSPGQRAMATAKVLQAAGRRVEGRWVRGSVVNTEFGTTESQTWKNNMARAGTILDHAPELVDGVARGDTPLDRAFAVAEDRRAPKRKPAKKRPVQPSGMAVQIADVLMTLRRTKARELSETVLNDLRAVRREIDRLLKDDLNGT